jgi:hypothetical protein
VSDPPGNRMLSQTTTRHDARSWATQPLPQITGTVGHSGAMARASQHWPKSRRWGLTYVNGSGAGAALVEDMPRPACVIARDE